MSNSPTGRSDYPSEPNMQNISPELDTQARQFIRKFDNLSEKRGTVTGRYSASAEESNVREIPRRKLDLSKYKTAAGAAKALYRYLCEHAAAAAASPNYEVAGNEVFLRGPNDRGPSWAGGGWHVIWESGPFEWAILLMGGSSMYLSEYGIKGPPEVTGFRSSNWDCDVGYSFSIVFRA